MVWPMVFTRSDVFVRASGEKGRGASHFSPSLCPLSPRHHPRPPYHPPQRGDARVFKYFLQKMSKYLGNKLLHWKKPSWLRCVFLLCNTNSRDQNMMFPNVLQAYWMHNSFTRFSFQYKVAGGRWEANHPQFVSKFSRKSLKYGDFALSTINGVVSFRP